MVLLLGVFFELMAMFSALVDFLFGVVVAVVIILIEMYLLLFYAANVRNNFESSKRRRDFFLPASFILVFLGSRRKKGNSRNNLAASAESEGSNFLYFLHFCGTNKIKIFSQHVLSKLANALLTTQEVCSREFVARG